MLAAGGGRTIVNQKPLAAIGRCAARREEMYKLRPRYKDHLCAPSK